MKSIFILFSVVLFLSNSLLFSQTDGGNINPKSTSPEVENLYNLQDQAKVNGNLNDVMSIQNQINSKTGIVSQSSFEQDGYSVTYNIPMLSDDININTLIASSSIRGLATCTEIRGANVGRIWMAVGYSGTGGGGDTIALFNSDNNGLTFTLVTKIIFNTGVTLKSDQLDMEIVENSTGDKYLWIVRGMNNSSTGIQYAGATILNTTTNASTSPILSWPGGNDPDFHYYAPRITSDNEVYASNPYVFIIASLDSASGSSHYLKVKYAQCNNPLDASPTINYNPVSISGTNTLTYVPSYFSDIAYYNNGTDSLIIASNNRTDSTKISTRTFRRSDALTNSISLTFDLQPSVSNQTTYPRLASSGISNIALVYRTNFLNSGDWDIRSYICKSGISIIGNWSSRVIDNTSNSTDAPGKADVVGVRLGTGSFRVCYGVSTATGFLMYANYSAASPNWESPITVLPTGASVGAVPPVAGYRFVSGDSAFMGYSGFNGLNAYGVSGSSGSTVGIDPVNNNPVKFELSQNYPNPFNPSTKIEFSIPERSLVRLEVYDVAGRLISLLANETMNAGKYQAEFNGAQLSSGIYFYKITAGELVDTKKMILVK